jgi:hypothetical protein
MSMSPADPERQRLFSPAVIAVLGGLVALTLALAFPREKLEARLLGGYNVDSLTIAYLEAWLRAEPGNTEVLAELTNEYLKGQRIADAERTLERLAQSKEPAAQQMALAIRLSIAQQRVYMLQPTDPARVARIAEFDALLHEAAHHTWNNEQLVMLAQQARALDDGTLATQFYAQLVASDPAHANQWRVADAKVELGTGHYQQAADAWFAAQADAKTLDERRAMFFAGLRALQSGDLLPQAIDAAKRHVGDLADDPDTLRFLTHLAMAAGRPDIAEGYVKRLLKMSLRRRHRDDIGLPYIRLASYSTDDGDTPRIRSATYRAKDAGHWLRIAAPATAVEGMPLPSSSTFPPAMPRVAVPPPPEAAPVPLPLGKPLPPAAHAPEALPPNTADEDLAYGVFLANGDVASAQRVAQRALDKAPQSNLWRGRLAQVAEWNRKPDIALVNWLALAKATGDESAWTQVARLAPGLNDEQAILAALLHQSGSKPDDLKLIDQVVASYERLADPDSGLSFLLGRAQGAMRRPLLERYAVLAERKGNDDLALHTWQTLQHDYGPNAAYGQKIATMLYARTDFEGALAALRVAQQTVTPADTDYWRFDAEIASILQRRDAVSTAYRAILASGKITPADFDAMINFYDDSPIDAGRLAELAFRQSGQIRMLQQALYNYQRAHAWGRIAAMLDALTPKQLAEAEKSAPFLLARSEYRRQMGDLAGAASDVRRAVALDPDNLEAAAAYLWDLIDRGTSADLRRALRRYADVADGTPSFWGAYAAAYQRTGDGRHVLYYLHKQAATSMKDPLWRLSWADALELNGRTDDAWRVRRQVWREMASRRWSAQPQKTPADTDTGADIGNDSEDLHSRMVALSQQFATGDVSRAMLIELLREDRRQSASAAQPAEAHSELGDLSEFDKLPPAKQETLTHERALYSTIAREAAISWAQGEGETDLEHAWLIRQYALRSTRPVYAEAQLAIDDDDVNTLDRLLTTLPDLIPRQNKVDAEALTSRYPDAQSDAFDSLTRLPNDEIMQAQLREQVLRSAQAVAAALRYVDQGPLRFTEESVTGGLRLTNSQSMQFRYMQRDQWGDATSMPNVPGIDRLFEAIYRHQSQYADERITLGRRDALKDFTTARAEGQYTWTPSLTLTWALGYNQAATESTQLQVGGTKDIASVGFNYRFDQHWFSGGRYEYDRFHGQDRSTLGTGNLVELNGGYKIKVDYPDYTVQVMFAHGQYNANGAPGEALRPLLPVGAAFDAASFMPQTFTQVGLLFSFGDDLPEEYTKAWRPMVSVGPVYDSRAKLTAQATVGVAGSVFGGDQAMFYGSYSGASATSSTSVKEIGVRYRWLY